MRQIWYLFVMFTLLPASLVLGQEIDSATTSNENIDYNKLDSLNMKLDSIIRNQYGITQEEDKDGKKLHTAMGLKLSSLGIGLEITLAINDKFSIRFSGSHYPLPSQATAIFNEPNDYELSNESFLGGAYLVADYQVVKFMHVTGGIVYKVAKEEGTAHPTEGITIGGIEIPADIVGQISYAVEQKSIGYYAGVGFGRTISLKRRFALSASLGAYYLPGQKEVELQASGMLAPTANKKQLQQLEENVGNQQLYPFISLQVSYRLF